jgi:hypothetical protein
MTTSRISEKSTPTQPSVPATTGKQRICLVVHANEYKFTVDLTSS